MSLKKMRATIVLVFVLALASVGSASAQFSPFFGGSGGGFFQDTCTGTQSAWGFLMRTGTLVDMIQFGCQQIGPSNPPASFFPFHGNGGGGGSAYARCPVNSFTKGINVYWGSVVNALGVRCYPAGSGTTGSITNGGGFPTAIPGGNTGMFASYECPANQAITGVRGRSGSVLDSISVLCAPR